MTDKKSKLDVHFTSGSQTWNTPKELYSNLNDLWNFTLDVACTKESALCDKYFTPEDDGLSQDWGTEVCWMNPPYNDIRGWCKKAVSAHENGASVVVLIPSRTDTQAFQNHIVQSASVICFIKGRLKFHDPLVRADEKQNSAPFPSMIAVLDKNVTKEQIDYLKTLGTVMVKHE